MEPGDVFAPFQMALLSDVELVLKDELQKLGMAETVGGGLLEADRQVGAEAGQAQLTQRGIDLGHGGNATL
jgi:hypothetical protein